CFAYVHRQCLRSFPTRRSSDLDGYSQFDSIGKYKLELQFEQQLKGVKGATYSIDGSKNTIPSEAGNNIQLTIDKDWQVALYKIRSEEHTSELQSRENLVCRLLL